jgi:CHAD domain-containing protein
MMAITTEIEQKFVAPDGFNLPDLTAILGVASIDDPVELNLDATYYDTTRLALARHRMTLRRRRGGHDAGWHLKRPAGGDRTELQLPATTRSRRIPAELVAEVWAVSRGDELVPIARVRNRRVERALRDDRGGVLALISDDSVASETYAEAGGDPTSRQWQELEAELVDGSREFLATVSDALVGAGARVAESPSKLAQALGDLYPAADGGSADGDTRHAAPRTTSGWSERTVTAYLRQHRDELMGNDPMVRVGDPDGVHDMRVAIRRLRATLRTFRSMLDRSRTEPLRAELQWLGGLLGAVRDGDVMRRRLDKALAAEPPDTIVGPVTARIHERLGTSTGAARDALAAGMTSPRYAHVLDELDAMVEGKLTDTTDKRLIRAARKAARRADVRLDVALRLPERPTGVALPSSAPQSRDVAFHDARKAYKRARYAAEALAPAAGKSARRLATRLRVLQDILGDHQDSVVAAHLLRDFGMQAHLDGDNAFSYGMLYARQTAAAARELAGLDRARRRSRRPSVRAWFD